MASKTQLATAGEQQAAIVINNSFIDGLVKQLEKNANTVFHSQKTTTSAMRSWGHI